ncbi:lysophospholipid acyltransferase family protein [Pseudovibrio sp. Tun.PSC04-5.I4]|uniref:lysophospholipid acyltransferase family protein n=1 Tax=Pseudovibrio sp. Tun.PSC04-5.I4 TaxID=1798213 RepID=UPI00088DAE31|nr:lysophospholipid acyltransferase family protein [Pseudovibrio sp. Tun.PSC04-5.I4]SDR27151.1 1-acyl-sn-glycerol-3-phosphate acyltransferase [Pseudovibrio sp. Tun.PSC04-5.I4]
MLLLRSILFNVLFYTSTLFITISCSFLFLLPVRYCWWLLPMWSRVEKFLLHWVGGVKSEITGLENLPKSGCIIVSKHQSAWETFALSEYYRQPTFIMKRELRYVPFFGWYLMKFRQIPVDRGKKGKALSAMGKRAAQAIAEGRNIIIYPEGTRRAAGAEPQYKYGIVHLYKTLNCPVVPIALNSGVYWPRHRFFRFPGTIKAEILKPIEPGLKPEEFFRLLKDQIETASDRLLDESEKATPDNIIIKEARGLQAEYKKK